MGIPLGFPWLMQYAVVEVYSPWAGLSANELGIGGMHLFVGVAMGAILGLHEGARRRPWASTAIGWLLVEILASCGARYLIFRGAVPFE